MEGLQEKASTVEKTPQSCSPLPPPVSSSQSTTTAQSAAEEISSAALTSTSSSGDVIIVDKPPPSTASTRREEHESKASEQQPESKVNPVSARLPAKSDTPTTSLLVVEGNPTSSSSKPGKPALSSHVSVRSVDTTFRSHVSSPSRYGAKSMGTAPAGKIQYVMSSTPPPPPPPPPRPWMTTTPGGGGGFTHWPAHMWTSAAATDVVFSNPGSVATPASQFKIQGQQTTFKNKAAFYPTHRPTMTTTGVAAAVEATEAARLSAKQFYLQNMTPARTSASSASPQVKIMPSSLSSSSSSRAIQKTFSFTSTSPVVLPAPSVSRPTAATTTRTSQLHGFRPIETETKGSSGQGVSIIIRPPISSSSSSSSRTGAASLPPPPALIPTKPATVKPTTALTLSSTMTTDVSPLKYRYTTMGTSDTKPSKSLSFATGVAGMMKRTAPVEGQLNPRGASFEKVAAATKVESSFAKDRMLAWHDIAIGSSADEDVDEGEQPPGRDDPDFRISYARRRGGGGGGGRQRRSTGLNDDGTPAIKRRRSEEIDLTVLEDDRTKMAARPINDGRSCRFCNSFHYFSRHSKTYCSSCKRRRFLVTPAPMDRYPPLASSSQALSSPASVAMVPPVQYAREIRPIMPSPPTRFSAGPPYGTVRPLPSELPAYNAENVELHLAHDAAERPYKHPELWTKQEVVNYFKSTDCAKYASLLEEQDIDGYGLTLLSEKQLVEHLGIKLGPALKICHHVRVLKDCWAQPPFAP